MPHRPISSTTALVATLSLLLPQATFAAPGDVMLMCEDGAMPPCADPALPMGAPFVEQADGTMTPLPVSDAQAWRDAAASAVEQARAARDAAAAAAEQANATAAQAAEAASAQGAMITDAQAAADAAAQGVAAAMANADVLAGGGTVEGGPQSPEEAAAAVDAATVAAQEADAVLQSATQAITDVQGAAQAAADAAAQAGQSLADADSQLAQAEAALAQAEQALTAANDAEAAAAARAEAEAAALAQAEAEAAAAQAEAEAAAAAQAEAEAAAAAQAEADAAAAAQAEADAAAAAQAAADQAAADAAAMAEAQAAADAAAADQAAADQAAADQAAADQAAADAAAADQAAADAAAAEQAAADAAAADAAAQATADAAAADAGQDTAAAPEALALDGTMMLCLDLSVPPCPEGEPVDGTPHAMGADGVIAPVAAAATTDAAAESTPDAASTDAATAEAQQTLPEAEAIPAEVAEQLAAPAPENAATTLTTGTEAAEMPLIEVTVDEAANADAELQLADLLAAEQARNAELAAEAAAAQAALAEAQAAAEAAAAAEATPEVLAQVAPADLIDPTVLQPEAAAVEAAAVAPEAAQNAITITNIVNETRSATQDFATTAAGEARDGGERDGLSDLEKALLLGLGAVAVGAILNNGNEVVQSTGDRVIARNPVGDLVVYRDDNAILSRAGDTVRTETFADGSTRTFIDRGDGTQVVVIRAADGRVLRRARVFADGTQIELIDDLAPSEPVNVVNIIQQAPAPVVVSASDIETTRLRDLLIADPAYDPGRSFSLRQVREIEAVRNLVPAIDLDAITFASGSSAIPANQLVSLVQMGRLIEESLARNPREIFLVEGHTDATGSDELNLTLSDRRAETVALALTTNFAIPPENLVVQGYGERYLKVETQAAEAANRRATIRRITPLLQVAAAN